MDVFGPVQSRRLGLSLGVNHLPPKTCTYSCVYCQLGRTSFMTTNRSYFSDARLVTDHIHQRVDELAKDGIRPDTITFVPNGEPTLDRSLGDVIKNLHPLGIQTAIITNASLLWHPECHAQVMNADIVSIKVDSVIESTWHKIDRPHGTLSLDEVFNGIHWFAQIFKGTLLTETMLVKGLNDSRTEAQAAATFIADLKPDTAYLALPLRPPAEDWVEAPDAEDLIHIFDIFSAHIDHVELMMDLPESKLAAGKDAAGILLSTLAVHPLSQSDIDAYLEKNQITPVQLDGFINEGLIRRVPHKDTHFYLRNY
jgi:wyosine [tRNA(Phe)-imidazoG37] synthetase (radical SAM superfamily)